VREVLKAEGFAPLPRRRDDERPQQPRPTVEPVADVRQFSLSPRTFTTHWRGAVPVRGRPGALGGGKAGPGRWLARFQNDPRPTGLAVLLGAQALVH
jgi:hypothetical protein